MNRLFSHSCIFSNQCQRRISTNNNKQSRNNFHLDLIIAADDAIKAMNGFCELQRQTLLLWFTFYLCGILSTSLSHSISLFHSLHPYLISLSTSSYLFLSLSVSFPISSTIPTHPTNNIIQFHFHDFESLCAQFPFRCLMLISIECEREVDFSAFGLQTTKYRSSFYPMYTHWQWCIVSVSIPFSMDV